MSEHDGGSTTRPIEILLVEDNPGDVLLTQEAFADGKIHSKIQVAKDGEEAISLLLKEEGYTEAFTPDLILLDLNLPKKDGHEVLRMIKSTDHLKHIPVIVLTSSSAERDIVETYDLHANGYLVKPVDLDQFAEVVNAIEDFWFTVVVLSKDNDFDS